MRKGGIFDVTLLHPPPHNNKNKKIRITMFAVVSRTAATRAVAPLARRQQRRGIVDWMTNYPDKVRRT